MKSREIEGAEMGIIQVLMTGKKRLNYDSSDFNEDYDLNAVK